MTQNPGVQAVLHALCPKAVHRHSKHSAIANLRQQAQGLVARLKTRLQLSRQPWRCPHLHAGARTRNPTLPISQHGRLGAARIMLV